MQKPYIKGDHNGWEKAMNQATCGRKLNRRNFRAQQARRDEWQKTFGDDDEGRAIRKWLDQLLHAA